MFSICEVFVFCIVSAVLQFSIPGLLLGKGIVNKVSTNMNGCIMIFSHKNWFAINCDSHRGLIKLVVGVVLHKLKIIHKSVTEHLVRMDGGVADLRKLLDIEASGFWLIVAHGMRGIGKTTLAKVVFNQLLPHCGMCSSCWQ